MLRANPWRHVMRSYVVGQDLFLSFGARHWLCLKLAVSVHGLSLAYTLAASKKIEFLNLGQDSQNGFKYFVSLNGSR